jgi:hypothetical protein
VGERFLILVPVAQRAAANALAKAQLDTRGGEKTFAVGLSPTGRAPATHNWCSTLLKPEGAGRLQAAKADLAATVLAYDADKDPSFPRRTVEGLGLQPLVWYPEGWRPGRGGKGEAAKMD